MRSHAKRVPLIINCETGFADFIKRNTFRLIYYAKCVSKCVLYLVSEK